MTRNDDRRDGESAGDAAQKRPPRVVSLLGQKAETGERPPRGDSSGGPDPLRSAHSTFRDLEPPRHDFDPEQGAGAVRAGSARRPARLRSRARAFAGGDASARTGGSSPMRALSSTSRAIAASRASAWRRSTASSSSSRRRSAASRPVSRCSCSSRRSSARRRGRAPAFDELASIARSRVSFGLPANARTADAQRRRLARAGLHLMLGEAPPAELEALGAALLRAASLLSWRESLWLDRPDLGLRAEDDSSTRFRDVAAAEARAVLADLADADSGVSALPASFRPAARYAVLAAAAIARQAAARPEQASPPRLSALARLRLLLRARIAR